MGWGERYPQEEGSSVSQNTKHHTVHTTEVRAAQVGWDKRLARCQNLRTKSAFHLIPQFAVHHVLSDSRC